MTTATRLRFIDADGHLLEHPSEMVRYAPKGFEDRIWHVETDAAGEEWIVMNGARLQANTFAVAGPNDRVERDLLMTVSSLGCAHSASCVPRTAIALTFLAPSTAPLPPRPAWRPSCDMVA